MIKINQKCKKLVIFVKYNNKSIMQCKLEYQIWNKKIFSCIMKLNIIKEHKKIKNMLKIKEKKC